MNLNNNNNNEKKFFKIKCSSLMIQWFSVCVCVCVDVFFSIIEIKHCTYFWYLKLTESDSLILRMSFNSIRFILVFCYFFSSLFCFVWLPHIQKHICCCCWIYKHRSFVVFVVWRPFEWHTNLSDLKWNFAILFL